MRSSSVPVSDPRTFADLLRTDPASVNPTDWRVDWASGPWSVKVYAGASRVPLGQDAALDRLLRGTFGLSRVRHEPGGGLPATPGNPRPGHGPKYGHRRPIPSGGAMYPAEAYVLRSATDRIYHYDPYRHELVHLPHPEPGAGLRAALGLAPGAALPGELLIITNRVVKNYFKYGDFATRLGAVDLGVALGRVVRLGAALFGIADVRVDFLDEAVNELIGVSEQEETAYAVVGLGPARSSGAGHAPATGQPPTTVERAETVAPSEKYAAMRRAAYLHTEPAERSFAPRPRPRPRAAADRSVRLAAGGPIIELSTVDIPDLLDRATMVRRRSNGRLFTGDEVSVGALAAVLWRAAEAVDDLVRCSNELLGTDIELYCALHRVEGVPRGWYRYQAGSAPGTGHLVAVGVGTGDDTGRELQEALLADSFNLELAAFTVHVAAAVDHRKSGRGTRGYREQQLGVGAAVEALTLAAAAGSLGSHPVLGFDAARVDRSYGLHGSDTGTHAQVSVGVVRDDVTVEVTVR